MTAKKNTKTVPTHFGPSYPGSYPEEMRRQLWPLCCGASIISGFKQAAALTDEELVEQIEAVIAAVPDHQVYQGEQMKPALTFLTLNTSQMASKKIMTAIEKAGFKQFAVAKPRGSNQGFFVKDTTNSFKAVA